MKTFKSFLTEQTFNQGYFLNIDIKKPIKDYDVKTPYDWYIEFNIMGCLGSNAKEGFRKWRLKNKQTAITCFIHYWKNLLETEKTYSEGDVLMVRAGSYDYDELMDALAPKTVVIVNGKLSIIGDFDMWGYDNDRDLATSTLPNFGSVSGVLSIQQCNFSRIPTWLPEHIGILELNNNLKLTSLKDINKIVKECSEIRANYCPLESNILGLIKIKGLTHFECENLEVQRIINRHLPDGNMLDCVDELEDAGYGEFAKL